MSTPSHRLWSHRVAQLAPYVPGEQPADFSRVVKLNTNENPFPPSPAVRAAVLDAWEDLRLYPQPESTTLREALAAHFGHDPQWYFVGNGSDEVLAHAFFAFFAGKGPILFPDVTYSFYPVYAQRYEARFVPVPLDDAMRIDPDDYRDCAGAVIANPNAPTGIALGAADIAAIADRNPDALVLVDEAYVDFGAESCLPLVAHHDNLLVVQTLSKSRSLAGARVGFAAGQPHLIEALTRAKNTFNSYPVDRLAAAAAVAALADTAYFSQCIAAIARNRDTLTAGLEARGWRVLPSAANFVFARHPHRDGHSVYTALKQRGVLVRHFAQKRCAPFVRITVGTDAQIDALFAALDEWTSDGTP